VEGPEGLDGTSFLPLLKGKEQKGREVVFTQIDSKAGGDAVPMRCVQDGKYGYIYNPFSDGEHWYRNNNEGLTMRAMEEAAKGDPAIAARVELFRHRVPEEFFDLEKDPNCLNNLMGNPEYAGQIAGLQAKLVAQMEKTEDPMLEAFRNREDRAKVDEVLVATYGEPKPKKEKKAKKK
jgi:N-sulfoglucosamine sulfohydrolase